MTDLNETCDTQHQCHSNVVVSYKLAHGTFGSLQVELISDGEERARSTRVRRRVYKKGPGVSHGTKLAAPACLHE